MQTVNKRIRVVAALIRKEDQVFATQRGYGAYKDWWEFPGGKVETGETPEEALVREIREELGAGIAVDRYLTTVEYDYPEFHLSMDCFWCHIEEGELVLLEHEAAKWLPLCHLRQVDWLPADVLVVEKIEEALSREDAGKTEKTVTESGADRGGIDRKNSEPGSGLRLQPLTPQYDLRLAELIRHNLKNHGLDIPGTVYFDEGLEHLSAFYQRAPERRAYFILLEGDEPVGGIGIAEFEGFGECAELQKLYLADRVKGRGLGYELIRVVEEAARERGYRRMYLETHTNLAAAIHVYERAGYVQVERPAAVVHSTMNRFYMKELTGGQGTDRPETRNREQKDLRNHR